MFRDLILPTTAAVLLSATLAQAQALDAASLEQRLTREGYSNIQIVVNGPILTATATRGGQQETLAFDRETGLPVALQGATNDGYQNAPDDDRDDAPGNDSGGGGEGDGIPGNQEN